MPVNPPTWEVEIRGLLLKVSLNKNS
jgi:hypothetical protein